MTPEVAYVLLNQNNTLHQLIYVQAEDLPIVSCLFLSMIVQTTTMCLPAMCSCITAAKY
jgi:hypothetical protein